MSAFEKLPREMRDLIYEHCLLYDGEIVPFPRDYEREGAELRPQLRDNTGPVARPTARQTDGQGPFLGYPSMKREAVQTANQPCIALLGVSSTIRDETASILFGRNTWRLSSKSSAQDDSYRFWETYAKYFRHVTTSFHFRDIDQTQLLDAWMGEMNRAVESSADSDHFDPTGTANIHDEWLSLLRDTLIVKRDILLRMNLKTLSLNFRDLFCPLGRHEALQCCLASLGSVGPWYRLEREQDCDSKKHAETIVKVSGLMNKEEKKLFWDTWGLKVD